MAFDVRFYNPANVLTGGAIGSLIGSISATSDQSVTASDFLTVTSDLAGNETNYYHRKLWLTNHESVDITSPEIWMDDLEYPSQLSIARELSADDTTADPYSMPSGYTTSDFIAATAVEDRIPLFLDTSDFTASADAGIWIRVEMPPGSTADPSAIGTLKIRGIRGS